MNRHRTPGQRAGLTPELVVETAGLLLAERGLGGLTMRSLAERLRVSPNALYSHVVNKEGLIDAVLDDVLKEIEAPDTEAADPARALHELMVSTYGVLIDHPDLVGLYLARQGARGPRAQHLGQIMLALLGSAGMRGRPAHHVLDVLIVYTIGFAAFVTSAVAASASPRPDLDESFEVGLRWLLVGAGIVVAEG